MHVSLNRILPSWNIACPFTVSQFLECGVGPVEYAAPGCRCVSYAGLNRFVPAATGSYEVAKTTGELMLQGLRRVAIEIIFERIYNYTL